MKYSLIFLALIALPCTAYACRELNQDLQFQFSDTVVVGWISSARIDDLTALTNKINDLDAFNRFARGNRTIELVVTQTRKGTSQDTIQMELSLCRGGLQANVGERVIAYHGSDGKWLIDPLKIGE